MATAIKRACDACHRRKVRCNGRQPCKNCNQASLSCTYDAVPQKKGPKGSRAKVISELRETQKQSTRADSKSHSPPGSPQNPRAPSLLTAEINDQCIDFFFTHMYPTMPILDLKQIRMTMAEASQSIEAYCLLCSLAAFMVIQPGMIEQKPAENSSRPASPTTNPALGVSLMEEAVRLRKALDYVECPSISTIITSFFLFGCCFGLNKHNTAWFHLREATALAQLLGMQEEGTYMAGDCIENSIRRRLFWLLFVTERAYALQKHKPLTLHATIELPVPDLETRDSITGFYHLVNLYRPFDDTFVGLWNKSRSDCSAFWLAQLQKQLTEALPVYLDTTESQAADLRISQQWLRTMVWQLSIANGCLSSKSPDAAMTFTYPIEIAKDLVGVTRQLPQKSMEVHGIGLIEKLFDVACTLVDVMSLPINSANFQLDPLNYLTQLISLISTLRGGESRYLPLITAKIQETLPALASPIMQSLNSKLSSGRGLGPKQSSNSSNSSASSPYSTPPFMHYYPLP